MSTTEVAKITAMLKSGGTVTFHLESSADVSAAEGIESFLNNISKIEWLSFNDPVAGRRVYVNCNEVAYAEGQVLSVDAPQGDRP
jgi:hypothetical protein